MLSRLSAEPVAVRVPATSANLGPGFDSFGLALSLHDKVQATATAGGLDVDVEGAGAGVVPRGETHLVIRALRATLDVLIAPQPGLRLVCRNSIPHGRGLGSSAAAIVAGIRLAEALVIDAALQPGHDLELATAIEGHPDNVAACLLGGFTVAWSASSGPVSPKEPTPSAIYDTRRRFFRPEAANSARAVRLDVHADVRPVVFVPPASLPTDVARAVLPDEVSHADASLTAGRAGLLVAALTSHPEHLLAATEDRLHQEFRRQAMPETLALVERLREAGIAAVVSGAGPGVLAFATSAHPVDPKHCTPPGWRALVLPVDRVGAATE